MFCTMVVLQSAVWISSELNSEKWIHFNLNCLAILGILNCLAEKQSKLNVQMYKIECTIDMISCHFSILCFKSACINIASVDPEYSEV